MVGGYPVREAASLPTEAGWAFLERTASMPPCDLGSQNVLPALPGLERGRPHFAGALGAALLRHALDRGWVQRIQGSRALSVTSVGRQGFAGTFGVAVKA